MSDKNDIRIDVVGDAEGFAGPAEAERELDRLKGAALAAGSALTTMATGVAGALAAWTTAQVAATFAIKDTADEVGKLAQRMGESVESVSELRHAFNMAGADAGQMAGLMKSLETKAQDAAKGTGQAAAAYKAMGISVTDGNGALKEGRVLLEEVADKVAGYRDGAAKAALVQDALGGSWVKMIPLLNGGAQGFREASAEARQLGVVFDEKLTKQAADLNDNLTRIKTAAEGAKIALGSELLPTVTLLSEEFVQGIKAAGGFWAALSMGATLNPFNSHLENIRSVRADLAKMESDQKEYGYLDEQRWSRKQTQLKYLTAMQGDLDKRGLAALSDGLPADEKPAAPVPAGKPPKGRAAGGGSARVSDFEREIQSLNEKIAVETLDLQTTEKLSVAEQAFARYQADLVSERKKLTAAEQETAGAFWQTYLARAKANAEEKISQAALEQQLAVNVKHHQTMLERIAAAERETELYGLTAAQVSVVEQARLADAIAIARENGASEEQLAVMREELLLRGKLSEALSAKEGKQYEIEGAKKSVGELDEFTKAAARNMQSAMADFFMEPFDKGLKGLAESFGKTLQRMVADAAAAQLGKLLFGDLAGGKPTGSNGWVGQAASWASTVDWSSAIAAFGFHEGGMVQPGGQTFSRMVPAGAFANARRFHEGGFAGDEVPAILKRGEQVLTPAQQQERGGMTINQTIYAGQGTDRAEVRRSAASGARAALGAMNGARRYA